MTEKLADAEGAQTVRCYPMAGLVYIYRLAYTAGGHPYITAEAEDENGVRRERSGLFPRDGRLARDFLAFLARHEVSPYTVVEIYDEFLALHLR